MNVPSVLAALTLAVGVPLNAYVTVRLWRLTRENPTYGVLRERAIQATAVLILVLIFGLVFVNNDLAIPVINFGDTKFITRFVMIGVATVPATYWLYLYR